MPSASHGHTGGEGAVAGRDGEGCGARGERIRERNASGVVEHDGMRGCQFVERLARQFRRRSSVRVMAKDAAAQFDRHSPQYCMRTHVRITLGPLQVDL